MKEQLTFLRVSEINIDALANGLSELHFTVRSQKRNPAFWRWRYFHNPLRKSVLIVALRGSRIVGMYGLLYLPLTVQGSTLIAGLMGDFSIHPSERSWRCYRGLVVINFIESQKDNPAFSFGTVPYNLKKLSQRLGAVTLGQMPVYLGFLNFSKILEGRAVSYPLSLVGWLAQPIMGLRSTSLKGTDLEIRSVENFDSSFDELWSSIAKHRIIAIIKNSAYLNWRYGKCPGCWFRCLAAYREKRLEGVMVFCVAESRNDSFVLELLVRDDNPEVMRALLLQALAELRRKRIAHVIASFPTGSLPAAVLKGLGFKSWGAMSRSKHVIIVASPAKEFCPELDLKNWDFSLGDWV
jgi:hypothetical protein